MLKENKRLFHLSMKTNIYKLVSFLLLEISIYSIYMYLDITGMYSYKISTALKFTGILQCWVFTLFKKDRILVDYNNPLDVKDYFVLSVALFFTVISDLFLLIFDIYILGVLTFCIVQFLYLFRITRWNSINNKNSKFKTEYIQNQQSKVHDKLIQEKLMLKKLIQNFIISILIIIIISFLHFQIDLLIIISVVYFISIFRNVLEGFNIAFKTRNKKHIIFAIGMFLFILCDINVGLFNMINLSISTQYWVQEIYNFASVAMWMFYLPAQVLIALSGEV